MRCIWCNSRDKQMREIRVIVRDRFGMHPHEERFLVCSLDCEQHFTKFAAYARRFVPLFLGFILGCVLILMFSPIFLPPKILPLFFVYAGVVILIFPFATPETVKIFGVRKSIMMVRGVSIFLIIIGIGLLIILTWKPFS